MNSLESREEEYVVQPEQGSYYWYKPYYVDTDELEDLAEIKRAGRRSTLELISFYNTLPSLELIKMQGKGRRIGRIIVHPKTHPLLTSIADCTIKKERSGGITKRVLRQYPTVIIKSSIL